MDNEMLRKWLGEAWAENARLKVENAALREQIASVGGAVRVLVEQSGLVRAEPSH